MKKCERKQTYIHIMGDPEEKREREKGAESYFKK